MIKDACLIGNNLINTGKECDTSMTAAAQLWAFPPDFSFTLADYQDDPVGFLEPYMHEDIGKRVYPFFGLKAPINNIENAAGSDVLVTLDDGTPVFLRYALYTSTYETEAGGLCYAKSLQGLNKSGYNISVIDQIGQQLLAVNADKTLRGLITNFMYAPAPKQSDLKSTPYLNRFQWSYSPIELVQNGKIFSGASPLLQLMGLIDCEIIAGTTTQSITHIYISVQTECAKNNIASKFGATPEVANFIITDKADGSVVTPTGAVLTGTEIAIAGTFVSGHTYHVVGNTPKTWYNGTPKIIGYDGSNDGIDIVIP